MSLLLCRCRPLSVSMGNAIKTLKLYISKTDPAGGQALVIAPQQHVAMHHRGAGWNRKAAVFTPTAHLSDFCVIVFVQRSKRLCWVE